MRKILVGSFAAAALASTTAFAADMAVRAPVLKAPRAPVYNWSGWHVGLNAGYSWMQDDPVNSVGTPLFANPAVAPNTVVGAARSAVGVTTSIPVSNAGGFSGGGQAGYRQQFGNYLVGIETDIQGFSGKGSGSTANTQTYPLTLQATPAAIHTTLSASHSVDWLGTLRGQAGFIATPTLLLYGTGGLAYGGVKSSTTITQQVVNPIPANCGGACNPYGSFASISDAPVGWAAGAGAEWMITGNWSAKLEYLYYDLGSVSYRSTLSNIIGPPGGIVPTGGTFYSLAATSSTRFNGNIVRVGLNYQFH